MTNQLKYFIGNWKMFGDLGSFRIIRQINKFSKTSKRVLKNKKIVLCIPNTLIYFFRNNLKSKFISLGAQNCHHYGRYGAFTGSVNAFMLKKVGAEYIILGHSENRLEGETNQLIRQKIKVALKAKLNVVFCIGETIHEKRKGKTFSVLKKQILHTIEKNKNIDKIIFAYEPVWAIGTNKIPNISKLSNIIKFIKNEFKRAYKKKYPKVLYGGSVNSNNIRLFRSIPYIDGFLIGGASQSSKKFIDIIKNYYK